MANIPFSSEGAHDISQLKPIIRPPPAAADTFKNDLLL
jgi:hypothetical protein